MDADKKSRSIYKIQRKEIPYEERMVSVEQLAFYPENPRIYSRLSATKNYTQENIQNLLSDEEHVKELRKQIDRDGQVNEPLFCISASTGSGLDGTFDYQVLEGNSRLAALRINKPSSLPPASVKCHILDFSNYGEKEKESLIFSLLGQFHITGKTDWEAYENAAYIYRRHRNQDIPLETLAKEIGKSRRAIEKMIEAFELMTNADVADHSRWSYFLAYVSSSKIAQHRKNLNGLDDRIVSLIKENKFPKAMDMRDSLSAILSNKKARGILLAEDEQDPFGEALETANISGDTDTTLKRLERYRKDLGTNETKKQIRKLLQNATTKGKTDYALRQIARLAGELRKRASS